MNLFIGLLSNQIENYNIDEAFLAQKAKIISDIELFIYFLINAIGENGFQIFCKYTTLFYLSLFL